MYKHSRRAPAKARRIAGGLAAALLLCGAAAQMLRPRPLRSDSPGVEWIAENGQIAAVSVRGQFPYLRVDCPLERRVTRDASGCAAETVCVYTMQAEPSFLGRNMATMKLTIEPSPDTVYILKFADKDVKIVNGKVVE